MRKRCFLSAGLVVLSSCGSPETETMTEPVSEPSQTFVQFNEAVGGCMAAIAARHEQFGRMRAEGKPITLANSLTVAEHVAESCSRSSAELNELQPVTGTERYSEQCRSDIEQLAEVTAKQVTFTKRLADESDSSVTSALLEEGAALGAKLDEFPSKLMSCATGFRRDFLRSGHEIPEEATRTIPDLLAEENATIAAMIRS